MVKTDGVLRILLFLGLYCSVVTSPIQAQIVTFSEDSGEFVVEGTGALPKLKLQLTDIERVTSARIAAMADALRWLARSVGGEVSRDHNAVNKVNTTSQTIESFEIGNGLIVSGKTEVKGGVLIEDQVRVLMEPRGLSEEKAEISVDHGLLHSPLIRNLDVFTFFERIRDAGITIKGWDYSEVSKGIVTVKVQAKLKRKDRNLRALDGPSFCKTRAVETTGQSSIILEVEGFACMGQKKSREDTRREAENEAKRKAAENAVTHIQSEVEVESGVLKTDLLKAYAKAKVKVIEQKDQGWIRESSADGYTDQCYRIRIKAEVVPDTRISEKSSVGKATLEDPRAPLSVRLWTDRDECRAGERIKIYLQGNKPFYGTIVYRDVSGNLVQLLPNPYRKNNYFNGGSVHELPGGKDKYDLEVCKPFGIESITLYASTVPPGDLQVATLEGSGVYKVEDAYKDLGVKTRSIKFAPRRSDTPHAGVLAEFAEASVTVKTRR